MSNYRSDNRRLAETFKALAHPVRLSILEAVRKNCCVAEGRSADLDGFHVGDIYDAVEVAPSTVSHHLRELKRAGLIVERRCGRFLYLTLGHETMGDVVRFALGELLKPSHEPAPTPRRRKP